MRSDFLKSYSLLEISQPVKEENLIGTVFIDSLIKKIHTNIGFLQPIIKDGVLVKNPF